MCMFVNQKYVDIYFKNKFIAINLLVLRYICKNTVIEPIVFFMANDLGVKLNIEMICLNNYFLFDYHSFGVSVYSSHRN